MKMRVAMEQQQFEPKRDRFYRSRGGRAKFLNIHCSQCGNHVALYQKDGPGALLRLYLDRIFAPELLAATCHSYLTRESMPPLVCSQCKRIIGVPMVYEPEKRLAYRLVPGAFLKSKSDGTFPPTDESSSAEDVDDE